VHEFVNPAYLALFGFPPDAVLAGTSILDLIAPGNHDQIKEHVARRARGESVPATYETRGRRVDGSEFDMEVNVSSYREDGAELTLVILRDLTERKRAEQESAERGAKLNQIMDTASVAIFLVDPSGRITHANRRMTEMFGCQMQDLVGSEYVSLVHPSEQEDGRRKMLALLASQIESVDLERLYWRRDGTAFWGHLSGRRFNDPQGRSIGLIGVIADIDTRKRTEERLRESEERYRQLFEAESDAVFLIDNETGDILMANAAASAMYGYSREELLAKKNTDLSAEAAETRRVTEETPIVKQNAVTIPLRYHQRQDGTVFPVEITGRFFEYQGRAVHIAAIRDITERKTAEESLRRSEERFRDLAEFLPLTIFETDLQGRFTYVNRAALETFGYTRQDVEAGLLLSEMLAPADRDRARESITRRLAGHADGYVEYLGLRRDGTTFPLTVASGPILRDGRPVGLRGIVIDLSERRQLEQELLKTQKLESIGTLAGGIAHDFNNLLQGIFGYISMAKLVHDQKEQSVALLERAEQALHQSVNLTSQLLTFSKGGKPVRKVLALRPVIESAVQFALSGSNIAFALSLAEDLSTVEADEGQLGQVLQNIVLNAEQAMPLGGRLQICARNVPSSEAATRPGLTRGDAVAISIADQGTGIAAAHLPRIFDPYFTTKEKGSGLGLATAYSIVRNHGGVIDVVSELGRGSTFTVYLPASGAPTEPQAPSPSRDTVRKGRVLVMDDEEIVRDVVGQLLTALGHEAAFVKDGERAVARYQEAAATGKPFDVVILDLTIRGGMGGTDTLAALLRIDPAVKAVASSGYSDDAALADSRKHGFKAFLKKPYVIQQLGDVLDTLLA
jgi:PAS domain S-box-containing protein